MMIESFREDWVESLFQGHSTRKARLNLPQDLHGIAQLKLQLINVVGSINDLRIPPGNRLERLKGDRSDEHAIRINGQFRIIFRHSDPDKFRDVGIEDYH